MVEVVQAIVNLASGQENAGTQQLLHPLHSSMIDAEVVRKALGSMSDCYNVCERAAEHEFVQNGFMKTVSTVLKELQSMRKWACNVSVDSCKRFVRASRANKNGRGLQVRPGKRKQYGRLHSQAITISFFTKIYSCTRLDNQECRKAGSLGQRG